MHLPDVMWRLPDWVAPFCRRWIGGFASDAARASFTIELARENIRRATGGPFAAAVFDPASGKLIAVGVNRVLALRCSAAHAEMLALSIAQQRLGSHDLGAEGFPPLELVSSTEPCAMCLGALPWSGIRRLVCCARGTDAEAIGMDEGDKPPDWVAVLESRGIEVLRDVHRESAASVLRDYAAAGGIIYNGRGGMPDRPAGGQDEDPGRV